MLAITPTILYLLLILHPLLHFPPLRIYLTPSLHVDKKTILVSSIDLGTLKSKCHKVNSIIPRAEDVVSLDAGFVENVIDELGGDARGVVDAGVGTRSGIVVDGVDPVVGRVVVVLEEMGSGDAGAVSASGAVGVVSSSPSSAGCEKRTWIYHRAGYFPSDEPWRGLEKDGAGSS